MKRSLVGMIMIIGFFLLIGANGNTFTPKVKRNCLGYSVIEVDKGIDCNGDTIKLIKENGFFERASIASLPERARIDV